LRKPWYDIGFQIDRLLISSFLPPFFMSFFIALVVLIMQFMWKFIDDIIGKGVGALVIVEMFFYKSVSLFPLALPIAVLLAGVMVMGNLAERYELSSFKSAGIPLTRILLPLIGLTAVIGLFSFYCSNTIIPLANLKYQSRLYDIRNTKPTLSIEPGVFNEDFNGYAIRVGTKHRDKQTIEDIMIYDDTQRSRGKLSVVTAKKGKMYVSPDDGTFVMTLYDGYQYSESDGDGRSGSNPFIISHFEEWSRHFDLSEFDLDRTEEDQFKSHHTMKSARQIAVEIDTLDEQIRAAKSSQLHPFILLGNQGKGSPPDTMEVTASENPGDSARISGLDKRLQGVRRIADPLRTVTKFNEVKMALDSLKVTGQVRSTSLAGLFPAHLMVDYKAMISNRLNVAETTVDRNARSLDRLEINRRKHLYELHWKFSLAAACVVMLMIGGPMGTIVRKGGFGYPLLIAIFFFTFFIMSNISCRKLSEANNLPPVLAAWLPVIMLFIISIFLTYKALQDAKIMDIDRLRNKIARWIPGAKLKPA
jgi:lipopolysaccharide export system permease protein